MTPCSENEVEALEVCKAAPPIILLSYVTTVVEKKTPIAFLSLLLGSAWDPLREIPRCILTGKYSESESYRMNQSCDKSVGGADTRDPQTSFPTTPPLKHHHNALFVPDQSGV